MSSNKLPREFSLTAGGALYRCLVRAKLLRPALDLLQRRIIVITLLVWLPPLFLSIIAGTAIEGVPVPFLYDIATHVRFLVAIPLLLLAEYIVHERLTPAVEQFTERDIVPRESLPKFHSIIDSVMAWRDSVPVELLLVAFVYFVGHFLSQGTALKTSTWYSEMTPNGPRMTGAGLWNSWVSVPVFQFLLLRWFFRWGLWSSFLWRVTRLPLRLIPTHPDRSAGLSFLSRSATASAPLVMALSAIVSGVVAGKILYEGASLVSFRFEITSAILFLLFFSLGPLCLFIPCLMETKLEGELEYGALAHEYVSDFDRKWNSKIKGPKGDWLGSADIQSLADIGNSYIVVDRMRMVPFDQDAVIRTVASALVPLAPLILFVIPFDQLIVKLVEIIF